MLPQYRNYAKFRESQKTEYITLPNILLDLLYHHVDSKLKLLRHVLHFRGIEATRPEWIGYM